VIGHFGSVLVHQQAQAFAAQRGAEALERLGLDL
jgi:hypothetical protein